MHSLGAFAGLSAADRADPSSSERPKLTRSISAKSVDSETRPRTLSTSSNGSVSQKSLLGRRRLTNTEPPNPSSGKSTPTGGLPPSTGSASLSLDVRAAAQRSALRRLSSQDTISKDVPPGRAAATGERPRRVTTGRPPRIDEGGVLAEQANDSSDSTSTDEYDHAPVRRINLENGRGRNGEAKEGHLSGLMDDPHVTSTPSTQPQVTRTKKLHLVASGVSQQCAPFLHLNEDRFVIDMRLHEKAGTREPVALLAVADGHGGSQTSDFVAKNLAQTVAEQAAFKRGEYGAALTAAFLQIDKRLKATGTAKESGACLCCCLVTPEKLYVANVGDCRLVLFNNKVGGDPCFQITNDHKATDATEAARVKEAGGFIVRGRVFGMLAVTRAIGDFEFKDNDGSDFVVATPEVFELAWKNFPGLTGIGIASDGIWDVLTNEAVLGVLVSGGITRVDPTAVGNASSTGGFLARPIKGAAQTASSSSVAVGSSGIVTTAAGGEGTNLASKKSARRLSGTLAKPEVQMRALARRVIDAAVAKRSRDDCTFIAAVFGAPDKTKR